MALLIKLLAFLTAVVVLPVVHAGFIKVYRNEPMKSSIGRDRVRVEENLERKIVEEKRTKKYYYAVRTPSEEQEILKRTERPPLDSYTGQFDNEARDDEIRPKFSSDFATYPSDFQSGERDYRSDRKQARMPSRFDSDRRRGRKMQYDNDFSDLPMVKRTTTVPPYLFINPEDLNSRKDVEDIEEQATQLYETVRQAPRKPCKKFKPPPVFDYDEDLAEESYAPKRRRTLNEQRSGPVLYNTINTGSYDTPADVPATPLVQTTVYASPAKQLGLKMQNDYSIPMVQNSIQTSPAPNDLLQVQLLKALYDNNILLQQQHMSQGRQQRFLQQQPPRIVAPPLQRPFTPYNGNTLKLINWPFKRSGETAEASSSEGKPSSGRVSRAKRSPLVIRERQPFPISFSIPILPSRSDVRVPSYAILDSELVHVGDFDSTEDVFEKLQRDFPPSNPWLFHGISSSAHVSNSGESVSEEDQTESPPPIHPTDNLILNIQHSSEKLANIEDSGRSSVGGVTEPPILFTLAPVHPTEAPKEPDSTNRVAQAGVQNLIGTNNGTYNIRFTSETGIDYRESGFVRPVEKSSDDQHPSSVANVKVGRVTWTSPEGYIFTLAYEADEKGYRPSLTQLGLPFEDIQSPGLRTVKFGEIIPSPPVTPHKVFS